MPAFSVTRNRDAYATIRGFVYQVELTIERWIHLAPDQILELECGEDIDTAQRALTAPDNEQRRLLEQVKHQQASLTLRSRQAIAALASFYEHVCANPELDIRCRYVTNATPAAERPSPLPGRVPAILAWEQLRSGTITDGKESEYLLGIRRLIAGAKKPDGLNDNTWSAFSAFFEGGNDQDLITFIRRVEWKAPTPAFESVGAHVKNALAIKHQVPEGQVQSVYERLFLYVFKLLSQPGAKRLTPGDLSHQLGLPALTPSDRELIEKLEPLLARLSVRVGALEEGFQELGTQVRALAHGANVDFVMDPARRQTALDMPPLVDALAKRENSVRLIADLFQGATWCGLYGDPGRGKTHLARLVAELSFSHVLWVRLRGLDPELACLQIEGVLSGVTGIEVVAGQRVSYHIACSRLAPGTVLVLDDLPRLSGTDLLTERAVTLAKACAAQKTSILSTSPYDLPYQVKEVLHEAVVSQEVPRFSNEEVGELLKAHGAPDAFCSEKSVIWLGAVTGGHPTLLTAAARYLAACRWQVDIGVFFGIIQGEYAEQVDRQTQLLLKETVGDQNERELLYRLNLISGSFNLPDVQLVAGVEPPVQHAWEIVQRMLGLWVQKDTQHAYLLSPLLTRLSAGNLAVEVERGVHVALAEAIIEKRRLSPLDVFSVIGHFGSAKEHNRAAAALLMALLAIEGDDTLVDAWGISEIWYNLPFPAGMDMNLRLTIRAKQVVVRNKLGKEAGYALEDLDRLVEQASQENAPWVIGALLMAGLLQPKPDPLRANRYLLKVLEILPGATLPDGEPFVLPAKMKPEQLIWATGFAAESDAEVRDWFVTIEHLTPDQLATALDSELADDGCLLAADRLWMLESKKPKAEQDWGPVLLSLEDFSTRALALDLQLLWACLIHARLIVLGEYRNNADAVVALAREALAQAPDEPRVRFLILETAGRQLSYAGRMAEALGWLESALAETSDSYPLERLTAILIAAEAAGVENPQRAVSLTQEAVELGRSATKIPAVDLVKALGENAIALWLAGNLSSAYARLQEAAEHLLACRRDDQSWKTLCLVLRHVLAYLSQVAKRGTPSLIIGGVRYEAPMRGTFLKHLPELVAHYNDNRIAYMQSYVAAFAEALGRDDQAATWALRAFDSARESGSRDAIGNLSPQTLQYLVARDRFAEALDVAREFGILMVALRIKRSQGQDILPENLDRRALLGEKPNDHWLAAEREGAMLGLVPIALRLATLRLTDVEEADVCTSEVASLCREVGLDAVEPTLWNKAAVLFDILPSEAVGWRQLADEGETLGADGKTALHVAYYIAASLRAAPPQALALHFAIIPYLFGYFHPLDAIYRGIISPFIRAFWSRAFREGRAYFRAPRELEKDLSDALAAPDEEVVKRVLRVIAGGVGITPDKAAQVWLDQASD